MPDSARTRLAEAGWTIPEPYVVRSEYVPARLHRDILFCAGLTSPLRGRVGDEVDVEHARAAARQCALLQLAAMEQALGDLDRVAAVLRLTGFVYARSGFAESPHVLDAASEVFVTAFGEAGRHARSAVAVAGLPGGASVELEVIVTAAGPAS
jgi:enamine deaminase RidA (YjgF/YER057c/UK114 family)